MPLNPLIPLSVETPKFDNPLDVMSKVTSLRDARTRAENNELVLDQNRQQANTAKEVRRIWRDVADPNERWAQLRKLDPILADQMYAETEKARRDGVDWDTKHQDDVFNLQKKQYGMLASDVASILENSEPADMIASYRMAFPKWSAAKVPTTDADGTVILPDPKAFEQFATANPAQARALLTEIYKHGTTEKERLDIAAAKAQAQSAGTKQVGDWTEVTSRLGATVTDEETLGKFRKLASESGAPAGFLQLIPTKYDKASWARFMESTRTQQERDASAEAWGRINKQNSSDSSDAQAIGDAIISGAQSPDLRGLYGVGPEVRAYLARKGYDLSGAQLDWQATQRYLAARNGGPQLRMVQAVDNAFHSLDTIEAAAKAWGGSRFPVLNRANLKLAMAGNIGGSVTATLPVYNKATQQIEPKTKTWTASEIARVLDAQIADVTSELANVYMGGNSPTDHGLQLAAHNLSSDWSQRDLETMLNQARTNLQVRRNSLNTGPVGVAGNYLGGGIAPQINSSVPQAVGTALANAEPGRHTLSDGSVWIKNADGTIRQGR